MTVKYLYLDDEDLALLEPLTEAVIGDGTEIQIDIKHPTHEGAGIEELINELENYNGLILDWRLDVVADPESRETFSFRAAAFAQEIRTRETEGALYALPIVLWSTKDRLRESFLEDQTAQDLFDEYYEKTDIGNDAAKVRNDLISLVNGYENIKVELSKETISDATLILKTGQSNLDVRLVQKFSEKLPVHEYSLFIIKEILKRPGLLIREKLLAAKLGIDIENSSDWVNLLNLLSDECIYRGPFHKGWPRWWASCVEKTWWTSLVEGQRPLSLINAQERIKILSEQTGLKNLSPAQPILSHYGTKYYTLCEYHLKPLDPLDGVIINEPEPTPWQERRYISLDVALERRGEEKNLFPHPTEQERVEEIRKTRSEQDER